MNIIYEQIKKDKKIIIISIICGIIITFSAAVKAYANRVSSEISDAVIRFHVLAKSREEAEKYLSSHRDEITAVAESVIEEEGYNYSVHTELSNEHYPVRYYGNAVFPEGVYKSLRVIIGEGEGHNWWCVMYPPLCLNGESLEYADTDLLKSVLTEDGYDVVVLSSDNIVPEMKFKVVEWFSSEK